MNYHLLLLLFLLAADLTFMSLHSLKSLNYLQDPRFSITMNFGFGESFQYLKTLFVIGCFLWLGFKFRKTIFYCWSAIFAYILLDDSLEIHEAIGFQLSRFLDNNIGPLAGIGGTAGEVIVFGFFGLALFIPLFIAYFRTNNKQLKTLSQDLFLLFSGMLFFGMGVDIIHDFAETGTVLNGMLGLIEDGGEMIMMSLIVWYTWTFIDKEGNIPRQKESQAKSNSKRPFISKDRAPIGRKERRGVPSPPQKKGMPTRRE